MYFKDPKTAQCLSVRGTITYSINSFLLIAASYWSFKNRLFSNKHLLRHKLLISNVAHSVKSVGGQANEFGGQLKVIEILQILYNVKSPLFLSNAGWSGLSART